MPLPLIFAAALAAGMPTHTTCLSVVEVARVWLEDRGQLGDPVAASPADPGSFSKLAAAGIWIPDYDTIIPAISATGMRWLFFSKGQCFIAAVAAGSKGNPA